MMIRHSRIPLYYLLLVTVAALVPVACVHAPPAHSDLVYFAPIGILTLPWSLAASVFSSSSAAWFVVIIGALANTFLLARLARYFGSAA